MFVRINIHTNNVIIRKYRFDLTVVQGHFAVLKTIDVSDGDDILCIEVVKMERHTSKTGRKLAAYFMPTKLSTRVSCHLTLTKLAP